MPLCARERERLLLGIEPPFYTQQRVRNLAFVIRKRTKNMVSVSIRVGICRKGLRTKDDGSANIYIYVRVASRNRTLAHFGDFDFSRSAVSTTPSAPFYKVSELYALAQ